MRRARIRRAIAISSDYSENLSNSATRLTPAARRPIHLTMASTSVSDEDRRRRRRHRVRARPVPRRRSRAPGTRRSPSRARPSCWRACAPTSAQIDLHRARPAPAARAAASSWCGRSASSTTGGCRSWSSAARSPAPTKCASWRRSASPATSTSTARCSTSCRRWRRTCSPTTSTAAAARASCSASRSQYRFGNTIAAALTLNLSHGGIAIRTTSPLDGGAKIKVRFRMPGSKKDIDAEGRVAWSDRRVGMGLQFEKVDPADQTIIDDFVDAHFFSQQKSVRPYRRSVIAGCATVLAGGTRWSMLSRASCGAGGLLALVLRQRVLRRRRVLDRHGAQDAHRSADRRRASRRARGAPRRHRRRTATSPRRSSASRWPASASAGSASRRSPSLIEPALAFLPRDARRDDRAQHRGGDRVRDHHRASHIVLRRAGAEMDRARARRSDGAAGRQAARAVHARVLAVHPRCCTARRRRSSRLLGLHGAGSATRWCTRKKS